MPLVYFWLLPLGVAIGTFGTLIGAGGGFILVPILLLVYPHVREIFHRARHRSAMIQGPAEGR